MEVFYITTPSVATIVERRWSVNELEQWRNAAIRVKPKYLEKKQSQCHRQTQMAFVSYNASFVCYAYVPCK